MVVGAGERRTVWAMRLASIRTARRSGRELGFTLLELLVSILLVDVAILAVLHTHAVVIRNRNETRARSAAVDAATARVEQIIASPCAAVAGSAQSAGSA